MDKAQILANFNPNDMAASDNVFGLPFEEEHAAVVILPVPWEVTVSYQSGTAKGPKAIRKASVQVDLFDPRVDDAYKMGVFMLDENKKLAKTSKKLRSKAIKYIDALAEGQPEKYSHELAEINAACAQMVDWVEEETAALLNKGKLVALLGGDHSTPLGYLKALAKAHGAFGILQIDAHADLRKAYEGFAYSHASIMHNALQISQIEKLVQVGIRDYCHEEVQEMQAQGARVVTYFDRDIKYAQFGGKTWEALTEEIVGQLPQKVYLSFDIDGLDPKLCPNTGTPVAGGFEVEQVLFLLETLLKSGRTLIGFDLNEVAPGADEWDANVGARLLYNLCNLLGKSNGVI